MQGGPDIHTKLDAFFAKDKTSTEKYRYFAGGPMTEYHRHLSSNSAGFSESAAMLQSFKRDSNLLGVQFNHMLNPKASASSMDSAMSGKSRLFLVPTELAKAPSPWGFSLASLGTSFGPTHVVTKLGKPFTIGSSLNPALFDLITAVYFRHPEIFPPAVKATYKIGSDGFVEPSATPESSKSQLYVVGLGLVKGTNVDALQEHQKNNVDAFHKILHEVFNGGKDPVKEAGSKSGTKAKVHTR